MKKLLLMLVALLPAFQGAMADNDNVAQAIWCSGNTTLYFDYCATVTVGSTYEGQTVTAVYTVPTAYYYDSYPEWLAVQGDAKTVVFKAAFSSFKPLSCYGWFHQFTQLTTVEGLANLNTSDVTNMDFMFDLCISLSTLDVSTFDVSKVTTAESMFYGCSELKTISCNKAWNIANTASLFRGATQLRGYDEHNVTGTMASPAGYFTATQSVTLNDDASNETTISNWVENHKNEYANVTLSGRKLYKDGNWNTLCLPFSMNKKQIDESPLAGATIEELDVYGTYLDNEIERQTSFDAKTGTLYLYFKEALSIEAGKPYIVKWGKESTIENPVFNNVSIDAAASTSVNFTGGAFKGTYEKITYTEENKSILFVGNKNSDNNSLYWPTDGVSIGAFRAYFQLTDGTNARNIVLNFFDEQSGKAERGEDDKKDPTGIISTTNYTRSSLLASLAKNYTNSAAWYDLQGRKLSGKPSAPGVYVKDGQKIIVK